MDGGVKNPRRVDGSYLPELKVGIDKSIRSYYIAAPALKLLWR
jgi:hypothetical protein